MKYYYINTDRRARDDVETCDLWFTYNMAFAGDQVELKKHAGLFSKLEVGDILFMYHTRKGYVGVGRVLHEWDHKHYESSERLFYREKVRYEYRVNVAWLVDSRSDPKSSRQIGLPVTAAAWCNIDPSKYKVRELIKTLMPSL